MSDFVQSKKVITRKDHFCKGCLKTIPKGAIAEHNKGRWVGEFLSYRLCMQCVEYMNNNPEDFVDGFWEGEIGEYRKAELAPIRLKGKGGKR